MTTPSESPRTDSLSRRAFVRNTALAAGGIAAGSSLLGSLSPQALAVARTAHAGGTDSLKIGAIGCGGRGSGAVADALTADPSSRLVGIAELFKDRLDSARANLAGQEGLGDRCKLTDDQCYTGFDAYKKLLDSDVDLVVLATPPGFRPIHFEAAIAAGKHVFMEKPVGVDPAGIRRVIAAAQAADQKKLCVVTGTQRRHEACYLAAIQKVREGAIGKVIAGRVYWNQGSLWNHSRKPEYSDMEFQVRNWLYYTWTSGDHIVEQHVHNIDVANWVMDGTPTKCTSMGGRQVRTQPEYGHIFDHFACEFTYPDGTVVQSLCRQIDGCANAVQEVFYGTKGTLFTTSGRAEIKGETNWKFEGDNPNPYVVEHQDLVAAIKSGKHLNEAKRVAESTATAIMGRMSAYTGKEVTWDFLMNKSTLDLSPSKYEFGSLPPVAVAVPGRTPLV
jgi:predicted dehydrogenase